MRRFLLLFIIPLLIGSCNDQPLKGDEVPDEVLEYLTTLYAFDDEEELLLFSCKLGYKDQGSFFTNKRIGVYWLYENATPDKYVKYALWEDVISMSYSYGDGWGKAAKIEFKLKDGSELKTTFSTDTVNTDLLYKEVSGFWEQSKIVDKDF